MKQLYMVALGGKTEQANIEVHDIQFVIGETIEETFEILVGQWYGIKKKLHMDSYQLIEGVGNYTIEIMEKASEVEEENEEIYLVNIGGYNPSSLLEIHRVGLFAAKSPGEARTMAKEVLFEEDVQQHIDNVVSVNKCIDKTYNNTYSIKVVKSNKEFSIKPDWFGYKRLDII